MADRKIYLIAGEASGDNLGAKLIHALKTLSKETLTFHGVGGSKMAQQGVVSLFPMSDLSLVGFVEIIPHIPKILGHINNTIVDIESINPDVVITIDAPAFNFRIAQKLRERGFKGKLVHYVAPSVWAYKPERALKIKQWYDHVLALLPIEPPLFKEVGLGCTFVGHPIVEESFAEGDDNRFRAKFKVAADATVIAIYPGSRKGELKRHLPVVSETVKLLFKQIRNAHFVIIANPESASTIQNELKHWNFIKATVVTESLDKKDALTAAKLAMVKSGTSTMEVALAGVPMVVFYKVNPISAYMLKRMIRVEYVSLINILAKEMILPEFLQGACNANAIALELEKLSRSLPAQEKQYQRGLDILNQLGYKKEPTPSQRAALAVMDLLKIAHAPVEEKNLHQSTAGKDSGFSGDHKKIEALLGMGDDMSAANMIQLPDARPTPVLEAPKQAKALEAPKAADKPKAPAEPKPITSTDEGF